MSPKRSVNIESIDQICEAQARFKAELDLIGPGKRRQQAVILSHVMQLMAIPEVKLAVELIQKQPGLLEAL